MAEENQKKLEQILINYNIPSNNTNLNLIAKTLLNEEKINIFKKIIQLAKFCIITDENEESFTIHILASENGRLLEDIQKLFVIRFIDSSSYDFTSSLFYRIKIYKNVSK